MKTKLIISLILIFQLFCFGRCESDPISGIIICNNSNQEIIIVYSIFFKLEDKPDCFKPQTDFEYNSFIKKFSIEPHSEKRFSGIEDLLKNSNSDTIYVYVYNRSDLDSMPCEEFKQENPIKKRWALTKSDLKALNWELIYP